MYADEHGHTFTTETGVSTVEAELVSKSLFNITRLANRLWPDSFEFFILSLSEESEIQMRALFLPEAFKTDQT